MVYLTLVSLLAILFLAWFVGLFFRDRTKLNRERISRNFLRCYPDADITDCLIDESGFSSLVILKETNVLGIVVQPSDRIVCRQVKAANIVSVRRTVDSLTVQLSDFVLPRVTFVGDGTHLDPIEAALASLCHTGKGEHHAA